MPHRCKPSITSCVWPCIGIGGLFTMVASAGCVASARHGEIPCGLWSGEGAFVYEMWNTSAASQPAESGQAHPSSVQRTYQTTLNIQPVVIDEQEACAIEIVSERGPLPDMGNETRFAMALVRSKRISDLTVLYRHADLRLHPKIEEVLDLRRDLPRVVACNSYSDRTVIAVQYDENFVDIFRFEGDTVEKVGMLYVKDHGFIHWTERLHRRK